MTPAEALAILEAGATRFDRMNLRVRLPSGSEYIVHRDSIEAGSDDFTAADAYVYGSRCNGRIHMRGRRRVDTRNQTRWFNLSNAQHVTDRSARQ